MSLDDHDTTCCMRERFPDKGSLSPNLKKKHTIPHIVLPSLSCTVCTPRKSYSMSDEVSLPERA